MGEMSRKARRKPGKARERNGWIYKRTEGLN
jgi:hypothetical protein